MSLTDRLVDDGVATGLTLRVGVRQIQHQHPKKVVVAVPVLPASTAKILRKECDELVAIDIPSDDKFLGAVGAYYDDFAQVEDEQVIRILDQNSARLQEEITPKEFIGSGRKTKKRLW